MTAKPRSMANPAEVRVILPADDDIRGGSGKGEEGAGGGVAALFFLEGAGVEARRRRVAPAAIV